LIKIITQLQAPVSADELYPSGSMATFFNVLNAQAAKATAKHNSSSAEKPSIVDWWSAFRTDSAQAESNAAAVAAPNNRALLSQAATFINSFPRLTADDIRNNLASPVSDLTCWGVTRGVT
jgi:hypothetical protein